MWKCRFPQLKWDPGCVVFWCLEGHAIGCVPGDRGHVCVWFTSSRCRWQRLQMSLCDLQNVTHWFKPSVKASFYHIILPLQKAMHSQAPALDEVKHIQSTAHYSFYYHKCQQSSSSLSLLLQWWKCQMHLQQSEHSDGSRAQQPITVLLTLISPPAFWFILWININTMFMQYAWDIHQEFKAQESIQLPFSWFVLEGRNHK